MDSFSSPLASRRSAKRGTSSVGAHVRNIGERLHHTTRARDRRRHCYTSRAYSTWLRFPTAKVSPYARRVRVERCMGEKISQPVESSNGLSPMQYYVTLITLQRECKSNNCARGGDVVVTVTMGTHRVTQYTWITVGSPATNVEQIATDGSQSRALDGRRRVVDLHGKSIPLVSGNQTFSRSRIVFGVSSALRHL